MPKNYSILLHASERLKDDKEVVLEDLKNSCYSLLFASDRLLNDLDFLEEVLQNYGEEILEKYNLLEKYNRLLKKEMEDDLIKSVIKSKLKKF